MNKNVLNSFFSPNETSREGVLLSVSREGVLLSVVDTRQRPGYAKLPIGLPSIETMPLLTSFGPIRLFDYYKQNEL